MNPRQPLVSEYDPSSPADDETTAWRVERGILERRRLREVFQNLEASINEVAASFVGRALTSSLSAHVTLRVKEAIRQTLRMEYDVHTLSKIMDGLVITIKSSTPSGVLDVDVRFPDGVL